MVPGSEKTSMQMVRIKVVHKSQKKTKPWMVLVSVGVGDRKGLVLDWVEREEHLVVLFHFDLLGISRPRIGK